ncbi:hypothetical protein R2325_16610 [Mycobacteroides chelonae]|uniref:hypothetical protein n=1 Tax=Mycobacteroides chelonae TaxID=1774 RepID=UPI002DE68422|nr:hypothetical protein [Mycobacteroides chelonae]MEC4873607.1 hypothetical protein [Mycobacteroides chelonae]
MTIKIDLVGRYGEDGWEDPETGENFYNDRPVTPYGEVENLIINETENGLVIVAAPAVAIIANKPPAEWAKRKGHSLIRSAFGFNTLQIFASNGFVRYRIYEEPIQWWDQKEVDDRHRIGTRLASQWTPVVDPPPRSRNIKHTKYLGEIGFDPHAAHQGD